MKGLGAIPDAHSLRWRPAPAKLKRLSVILHIEKLRPTDSNSKSSQELFVQQPCSIPELWESTQDGVGDMPGMEGREPPHGGWET